MERADGVRPSTSIQRVRPVSLRLGGASVCAEIPVWLNFSGLKGEAARATARRQTWAPRTTAVAAAAAGE